MRANQAKTRQNDADKMVGKRVEVNELCFNQDWVGLKGVVLSRGEWAKGIGYAMTVQVDDGQTLVFVASSLNLL